MITVLPHTQVSQNTTIEKGSEEHQRRRKLLKSKNYLILENDLNLENY